MYRCMYIWVDMYIYVSVCVLYMSIHMYNLFVYAI